MPPASGHQARSQHGDFGNTPARIGALIQPSLKSMTVSAYSTLTTGSNKIKSKSACGSMREQGAAIRIAQRTFCRIDEGTHAVAESPTTSTPKWIFFSYAERSPCLPMGHDARMLSQAEPTGIFTRRSDLTYSPG